MLAPSLADGALIMLDAHADGEGLFLHGNPRLGQHLERVPCGVTGGQDQSVAGQGIGSLGPLHGEGGQRPAGLLQPGQPVPKAHVAAQRDKLLTDALHRLAQHIGADVGLVGPAHVRRGPGLDQGVQHRSDAGVVGAGGQLAVGEGACAPLAELYVRGGVQFSCGPEALHVRRAPVHILTSFQYHAGQAVPGQKQCGKQSRRPHAHHHRGQGGAALYRREDIVLGLDQGHGFPRCAADHGLLIGQVQAHGIDIVDVPLVSGIDGLAQQGELTQRPGPQPQRPGGLFPQLVQTAVDGKRKVGNLDHVETPLLS